MEQRRGFRKCNGTNQDAEVQSCVALSAKHIKSAVVLYKPRENYTYEDRKQKHVDAIKK